MHLPLTLKDVTVSGGSVRFGLKQAVELLTVMRKSPSSSMDITCPTLPSIASMRSAKPPWPFCSDFASSTLTLRTRSMAPTKMRAFMGSSKAVTMKALARSTFTRT